LNRLDKNAAVACSLSDADFRERRTFARKALIARIASSKRIENGIEIQFDRDEQLSRDLMTFVDLERQCCGFLTFTILTAQPGALPTGVRIQGGAESQATIEMFVQAIDSDQGAATEQKETSIRLRHARWSGIAIGAFALLACELPIILAVLGGVGLTR